MGYSGKPILTGDLVPEKGGTGFILSFTFYRPLKRAPGYLAM